MKRLCLSLICLIYAVFLSGCGLQKEGMVLLTDESWRVRVLGASADGFAVPDGLLWRQGSLYLADEGASAVRVWGPGGIRTICDARAGVRSPEDLVMDAGDNVFFSDDDAGGVWRIDPRGQVSLLAGRDKGLTSTEAIALDPEGNILVGETETHQVFRVSRAGQVSVFLGPQYHIRKPESMVYDEAGNLYIADNEDDVVYRLTPAHALERMIAGIPDFSPETLWHDHGTLYITDSRNGRLWRHTAADGLRIIAVFGGKLHAVNGLTTDGQGNLYLSIQTDLKHKTGYLLKMEREQPLQIQAGIR